MKLPNKLNILYIMSLWMFVGCGVTEIDQDDSSKNIYDQSETAVGGVSIEVMDASTDNYKVLNLNGDKRLQVKLGSEEKDLYVLFTNLKDTSYSATVNHNQKIDKNKKNLQNKSIGNINQPLIMHSPSFIQEFNNKPVEFNISKVKKKDIKQKKLLKPNINDSEPFYMETNATDGYFVNAKAKKVITANTLLGEKSLIIWVDNSSWGDKCKLSTCITQVMVDKLADNFLKKGLDNDIYDWVTNVYGEEWGRSKFTPIDENGKENTNVIMIDATDEINILLTDISRDDEPNGGTIGYFHGKDNYNKAFNSASNERIMFYIDSVMYANGGKNWDEDNFWAQQVFSTLAHEFQHMIYFYQKNVKRRIGETEIWLNEMLSESTEDLLAVKMKVDGPRNVIESRGDAGSNGNINGRYPRFNSENTLDFSYWTRNNTDHNRIDNEMIPYYYSSVSSFGAYLLRNYGGGEVLHNIVDNNLNDKESLMYAVHKHVNGKSKTFDDLIHEWGVAVLLSKRDDISNDSGELYNAGDFISSDFNGIHYDLGSINFFNYNPAPTLSTKMGQIAPHANYYYKVGENLKGNIDVEILNTAGLNVSVVVVK